MPKRKTSFTGMMNRMLKLVVERHSGQERANIPIPYALHCAEVAKVLSWKFGVVDETTLTAALGHDLLEDTKTSAAEIRENFGSEVLDIIQDLTVDEDPKTAENDEARWRRRERVLNYYKTFATKDIRSVVIKIADRYCNVWDYYWYGSKKYAARYAFKIWPVYHTFHARIEEAAATIGRHVAPDTMDRLEELQNLVTEHWRDDLSIIDPSVTSPEKATRIVVENIK